MGIDTSLQIEVLIAFGVFTAAVITAFVWYLLKSKSFPDLNRLNLNRLNLIVLSLFFFAIAAVMSFVLFNALAYGETRIKGQVYSISQDSVPYWLLVVMYYSAAVATLSLGLVVVARLIQPQRSLSEADFTNKAVERVGESAGASSDSALDAEEMSDHKPLTMLWVTATIVYFAAIMYSRSDCCRDMPLRDWGRDMPLPLLFAPIFVSFGLLAIYTGEFRIRGGTFYRSKNPIMYWLCVATIFTIGISLFLVGIGVIGR